MYSGSFACVTPSVKPCGFASSLGEGASGETGYFAFKPECLPLCQRPHLRGRLPPAGGRCRAATKRGICRRRRLGEFLRVPPQSRLAPCQLPQGDALDTAASFLSTAKAVPLRKMATNAVNRRKGYSTAAPRFRRKQALQMQFPAATPSVKKAFRALRRVL